MLSIFVGIYLYFCRDSSHFNGIDKKKDKNIYEAFLNRFYFVLITFTTIGYGDITPKSNRAKIITCLIILFLMINILKAFDSLISSYHGTFDKYTNIIKNIK